MASKRNDPIYCKPYSSKIHLNTSSYLQNLYPCFVYTASATTFLKKCLKTSFYQNIFTEFQQNKSSLSPSPPNWNGNHVIRYKWVCINFSDLLMSKITSHQYIIMPLKYFTSNFALAHICINLWLCPFWLSFLSVHS